MSTRNILGKHNSTYDSYINMLTAEFHFLTCKISRSQPLSVICLSVSSHTLSSFSLSVWTSRSRVSFILGKGSTTELHSSPSPSLYFSCDGSVCQVFLRLLKIFMALKMWPGSLKMEQEMSSIIKLVIVIITIFRFSLLSPWDVWATSDSTDLDFLQINF